MKSADLSSSDPAHSLLFLFPSPFTSVVLLNNMKGDVTFLYDGRQISIRTTHTLVNTVNGRSRRDEGRFPSLLIFRVKISHIPAHQVFPAVFKDKLRGCRSPDVSRKRLLWDALPSYSLSSICVQQVLVAAVPTAYDSFQTLKGLLLLHITPAALANT